MQLFKRKKNTDWIRYRNPDGTLGGTVKKGSVIPRNVTIHPTAIVLDATSLEPEQVVNAGEIVVAEGRLEFT